MSRVHGPCIVGSAGGAAVGCHTGPRIWAVGTRAWPSVNQFEPAHVSCPGPRTQVPVAAAATVHGSTITPAQWYTTPAPGSWQPPLPLHYPNPRVSPDPACLPHVDQGGRRREVGLRQNFCMHLFYFPGLTMRVYGQCSRGSNACLSLKASKLNQAVNLV